MSAVHVEPRMVAVASARPGPRCSRGCHVLIGANFDPHNGRRLDEPSPGLLRSAGDVGLRLALGAALAIFLLLALVPHTGLYRPETVLSGSMKPYFKAGDMVIVTPESTRDLRVGQVISFHIPTGDHHVQTHRVVAVLRRGEHPLIRTKGDANKAADPWTARLDGSTAWRVRLAVPKLGWLIVWLRDPLLRLLSVFLAPTLFALLALWRIWGPQDDDDGSEEVPRAPSRISPLA